jgi:hypothetical protein
MIGLFIKRGWFWELMFWLLIVELARLIGGYAQPDRKTDHLLDDHCRAP